MKKLRRVNAAKRKKERKETQRKLAERTASMLNHPTECCVCGIEFVRNRSTVKTWHVTIREDRVRLACPDCWCLVQETVEDRSKDNTASPQQKESKNYK